MGAFFLICILGLIGFGVYAIKKIIEKEKIREQEVLNNQKEYRRQCRVCGTVFCFTDTDLEKNKANQTLAALHSFNSITSGKSSYRKYEERKMADSALSKIISCDKCPNCNSTDLTDITDKKAEEGFDFADNIEKLKKYKELLDAGIISQKEFDEQKNKLLNQ